MNTNTYPGPIVAGIPDGTGRVSVDCPWCPDQHWHGEGYGHVIAHCRPIRNRGRIVWEPPTKFRNPGYIIADADSAVDWEMEYAKAEVVLGAHLAIEAGQDKHEEEVKTPSRADKLRALALASLDIKGGK